MATNYGSIPAKKRKTKMAKRTKEIWVCKECESTDVMQDAWVDVNTVSVISTFDNFYCNSCEGECSVKKKRVPA